MRCTAYNNNSINSINSIIIIIIIIIIIVVEICVCVCLSLSLSYLSNSYSIYIYIYPYTIFQSKNIVKITNSSQLIPSFFLRICIHTSSSHHVS